MEALTSAPPVSRRPVMAVNCFVGILVVRDVSCVFDLVVRDVRCVFDLVVRDVSCVFDLVVRDVSCVFDLVVRDVSCVFDLVVRDVSCVFDLVVRDVSCVFDLVGVIRNLTVFWKPLDTPLTTQFNDIHDSFAVHSYLSL